MRAISQCSATRGWWLLPPLLALALAMPADAQDTLALHVGDVVRVQLRGHPSPSYEGRLLAFDRDSLAIAAVANSNATVSIRRSDISRVLVSDGRSRSTWAGMGLGLLTGAALGAAAGPSFPTIAARTIRSAEGTRGRWPGRRSAARSGWSWGESPGP